MDMAGFKDKDILYPGGLTYKIIGIEDEAYSTDLTTSRDMSHVYWTILNIRWRRIKVED